MNNVKKISRKYRKYKRFMKKKDSALFRKEKELKLANKKIEVLKYLLNERDKEISELHQIMK